MAVIYATLIVKGKKTYAQVPDKIKPQVKQILIDLECEELMLSRLVDTFFSRTSWTMLLYAENHSISVA